MSNFYGDRKERIYDYAKNDSRMTVSYVVVNNDSLGGGGFGEVFLVQKESLGDQPENQTLYAMKRIKKDGIINDKDKLHRVLTEIKIHRSLNNPYICKYEHSFEDKNSIYILMEYCEKKSLDDYLKLRKTLSEYETRYYMFQVLKALKYLRRQKVIHRDLTLANVFLKDYKTIKIGDFGLSYKETENEEKQGLMCGTQGYFTPESYTTKYSYKTDIFDFGVCIYHLMTGNTLFKDSLSSFESVRKGEIVYDDKIKFSSEAKDLLKKIFVLENQRIDLDKIYQHDFFNEGKGLVDIEFPDYFKMAKKDFEEKIRDLEQNIKMTNVSYFPRKNTMNKEEGYPFLTKKSLNESTSENAANRSGLNESLKTNGLQSNKRIIDLGKNKLNSNGDTSDSSVSEDKSKRLRGSLKIKKNAEEEYIEREVNRKKRIAFNLSDDKKDKIINEVIKEDLKEVNLKEKLEQNLEKIKKENKLFYKNNHDEELNTFKLRQSTKSLDINYDEGKGDEIEKDEETFRNDKIFVNEKENQKEIEEPEENEEDIYIKRIIEINEKFGIAYELSNKDIGILFNDFSHITKFKKIRNLIYYLNKNNIKKIILPLKNERDKDLNKKVYYLGYIIDELKRKKVRRKNHHSENEKSNLSNNNSLDSIIIDEKNKKYKKKNNIYLMKFKKNNYAFFYILSNNNIQIDFFDRTKIIFSSLKNKKIIYVDNKGNVSNFELNNCKDFSHFKCDNEKINAKIKYSIRELKKF